MMRNISGITGAMGAILMTFAGAFVADTEKMTHDSWTMVLIIAAIAFGCFSIALYTHAYANWKEAEEDRLSRNLRKYADRQKLFR